MSDCTQYYFLKLKDNFFDRAEIKAIESMQNGYEYICIMQKMYLRSLSRNGKLMLTDTVPYELSMLSRVLGHKEETIKCAIEVFVKLGLCEILSDKTIYMTEIQNFIGKSSSEGDRKREYRAKIDEIKRGQLTGQMSDERAPEKELELEKEQEIETEDAPALHPAPVSDSSLTHNSPEPELLLPNDESDKCSIPREDETPRERRQKRFTKPTIAEITCYMTERSSNGFTAEQFFNYYESNGWMVGKTHMKDWKACIRTWEQRSIGSNNLARAGPDFRRGFNPDDPEQQASMARLNAQFEGR